MKKYSILLVLICFVSCSGPQESPTEEPVADLPMEEEVLDEQYSATEVPPEQLSGEQLGKKAGDIYVRGLESLTTMLKDSPQAVDILPEVIKLKEGLVGELVEIGYLRKSLDADGKSAMNLALTTSLGAVDMDMFDTYNECMRVYSDNQELHELIFSFNIITQYADFELLKEQEPEEAARLGIE